MSSSRSTALAGLGIILLLTGSTAHAAFEEGIGVQIPVIVNLYPGCGTTEAEAKKAVEETNKLLKQAGFKLVVVKVNKPPAGDGGDDGSDGGTAKDGKFTRGERDKIRTFGGKELKKLKNEKGIKLSFGKEPDAGTGTYGLSIHRNPTIVLRESTAAEGGAVDTGKTIAHELGHVLTLGEEHKVEDINNDSDFDDPNEKADGGGHSYDPNHIMHEDGKGTKLTKAQIEEMKKNKYKHGKCSVQWDRAHPAKKIKLQYGATTDARGDHLALTPTATGMFDIDRVVLTSLAETDHLGGDFCNIDVQFTVAGVLAPGECFGGRYALGFDSDADPTTGEPYSTYEGIDRIVNLYASLGGLDDIIIPIEPVPLDIVPIPPDVIPPDLPVFCLGELVVRGEVVDLHSGAVTPLPETPVAVVDLEFDAAEGATQAATSFLAKVPKCLLGLSAPEVPVVAVSSGPTPITPWIQEPPFAVAAPPDIVIVPFEVELDHTDDLVFDRQRWLDDPDLVTFGNGVPEPGALYDVEISGLQPDGPYTLHVNDTAVLTGMLDPAGHAGVSFIFPADLPDTEIHFLTAQDMTGEFAYGITCPRTVVGDLNGDNRVDAVDLSILAGNWLDGVR